MDEKPSLNFEKPKWSYDELEQQLRDSYKLRRRSQAPQMAGCTVILQNPFLKSK